MDRFDSYAMRDAIREHKADLLSPDQLTDVRIALSFKGNLTSEQSADVVDTICGLADAKGANVKSVISDALSGYVKADQKGAVIDAILPIVQAAVDLRNNPPKPQVAATVAPTTPKAAPMMAKP